MATEGFQAKPDGAREHPPSLKTTRVTGDCSHSLPNGWRPNGKPRVKTGRQSRPQSQQQTPSNYSSLQTGRVLHRKSHNRSVKKTKHTNEASTVRKGFFPKFWAEFRVYVMVRDNSQNQGFESTRLPDEVGSDNPSHKVHIAWQGCMMVRGVCA